MREGGKKEVGLAGDKRKAGELLTITTGLEGLKRRRRKGLYGDTLGVAGTIHVTESHVMSKLHSFWCRVSETDPTTQT